MNRTILTLAAAVTLAAAAPAPTQAQAGTEIYLLEIAERDGRVLVIGAPARVTDRPGYDNQPAFTPDGGALLYTRIGEDGQADTWRYDLARAEHARVTQTVESEYSPTPMPVDGRFSVVRVERDSTQRLWSFASDGTDPRLELAHVRPVGYHAWVARDRVGLFVLGDPATLRLADLATGHARLIEREIGRSIQPVHGRAGLTFTQPIGDRWWIRELDLDAMEIRPVAPLQGPDEYHAWTPAGALLTAHGTGVYQWNRAGVGGWRLVADLAESGLGTVSRLAVSPDGRRVAVVVDEPEDGGG